LSTPPRRAERTYANITHWNEQDKVGHFAAFEQPEAFVGELGTFFREFR